MPITPHNPTNGALLTGAVRLEPGTYIVLRVGGRAERRCVSNSFGVPGKWYAATAKQGPFPVGQVHWEVISADATSSTIDIVKSSDAVVKSNSTVETNEGRVLILSNSGDKVVYACDIGSTRINNFGWARKNLAVPDNVIGSTDIDALVLCLMADMRAGCRLSLGIESPLFLPVPISSADLSRGRDGEGNRAWSAPAGAAVTTLGLHQLAWILRPLASEGRRIGYTLTSDLKSWTDNNEKVVFCWEALVSNAAHSPENNPIEDAVTAVQEFAEHSDTLGQSNAVSADPLLSLIGVVALWSGWSTDVNVLKMPTLVLAPKSRSAASYRIF